MEDNTVVKDWDISASADNNNKEDGKEIITGENNNVEPVGVSMAELELLKKLEEANRYLLR